MGQYTNKGLYNAYKKNNKERAELDYYATPTAEVVNILNALNYDFSGETILEPCIGGGHMLNGIIQYCEENNQNPAKYIGTEWADRGYSNPKAELTYELDFLADDYPTEEADIIIMNPPYATLEPFLIRALEIAQDKLIVLCRTQVLEGVSRYKNIFSKYPPTDVYQYIDRIQCWKNGEKPTGSSAQAYCWLVWDIGEIISNKESGMQSVPPRLHWIHRVN